MFSLTVYQPLKPGNAPVPITYIDINPKITALSWSTVNPGGFGVLDVGMQAYIGDGGVEHLRLPSPIDLKPFSHVELRQGRHLCFEGRIMGADRNGAGQASGFSAEGYGICAIADNYILSSQITKKTSGVIVQEVIQKAAPLLTINPNTFVDPGIYHSKSEYTALYPQDVINAVIREGGQVYGGITTSAGGLGADTSAGVWDWLVYEGRQVIFTPRLPPAGTPGDPVDWWMPFDERVTWHEDYHPLVGSVAVRYKDVDSGGTTRVTPAQTDAQFSALYGTTRSAILEGGSMRTPSAVTMAVSYLANRGNAAYAVRIALAQLQSMVKVGFGDTLPPWHVRAGDWVQVGDQPFLPITSTQYDAMAETLVVEAGEPMPSGSNLLRTLKRVSNHVVRGTNPVSGARA